jgi:FkbM family methyltransferase
VEPQPDIATLLTANLARFPAARSSIVQVALSDVEGETLININRANRGASSIHYEFDGGAISVPTISANDLLGSMDQLDLIKIDVEGHEETILRNAQNQINRLKPRVIQFEDREGKAWAKGGIGSILYDLNYKVYAIKKSLFRTRLFLVNSISDCVDNDYVAISSWVNVAIPSKYK